MLNGNAIATADWLVLDQNVEHLIGTVDQIDLDESGALTALTTREHGRPHRKLLERVYQAGFSFSAVRLSGAGSQ